MTQFANDQRVRNNKWQRLCPPMLVDPRTTRCRAARTIAGYIHRSNRTTAVRTTRACLRNSRPHRFAQLLKHQTRSSVNNNMNCVTFAARSASQQRARVSQLIGRFSEIEDLNRV
jgi:hypothetical protein